MKSELKPQVGSRVEYHDQNKYFEATVKTVHNDTVVDLSVDPSADELDKKGQADVLKTSVPLDNSDTPGNHTWRFPR